MKILVTGANGQVGQALQSAAPSYDAEIIALDRQALDISDRAAVKAAIEATAPDVVINAAAYTAVDKAEDDVEAAFAINAMGPENLAASCGDIP